MPDLTARAAEFPLDERLAGQLMLAWHAAGRSAGALAVYGSPSGRAPRL